MIIDPIFKELYIKNLADTIIAKSLAESLAKSSGFDSNICEKIKLVSLELSKNLVNHNTINGSIRIIVNNLDIFNKRIFNICALDEGPGIKDIYKAIIGQSLTKVGLGKGLASVFRLSDYASIISNVSTINNGGTIISTCFTTNNNLYLNEDIDLFCIMKPNEASNISNDLVFIHKDHRIIRLILIDLPGIQDSADHKKLYENLILNVPLFWSVEKILEVIPQSNAAVLVIKLDTLIKKIDILVKDNIFFFQNGLINSGHISQNSYEIFSYNLEHDFLLICYTDGQIKFNQSILEHECISNSSNYNKTSLDIYLLGNILFHPKRVYEDTTLLILKWKKTK